MDAVYKAGKGDLARGTVNAFRDGLLDVPFAPSRFNANKVLPARDHLGYVRILDLVICLLMMRLKVSQRKLEERAKENREVSFQMTVDDIYALVKAHWWETRTFWNRGKYKWKLLIVFLQKETQGFIWWPKL